MHIVMIAPNQIPVPTLLGSSVEICMYSIAQKLALYHKVTIISRQHSRYAHTTREGNLTIRRVPTGSSSLYLSNVIKVMKGMHFDIIQVDNRPRFAAVVKAHFPSKPITLFLHSLGYVRSPAVRTYMSKVNLIIANSRSLHKELSRLFPKQSHKIKTVLLGTDLTRFKPPTLSQKNTMKQKHGLSKSFTVLYTGRLIPRKGISVLIKAVQKVRRIVPHARLVIAGGGSRGFVQSLKRQARLQGVPAKFVGYIPHRNLHRIYWLADCFVCPSQKHEAFGLVNVEAMASGVPVVASAIGGIKEIIKHKHNGLLVYNYRKPEEFAKQITIIAKQKTLAEHFSYLARADALRRFSWNVTATRLASVYRSHIRN